MVGECIWVGGVRWWVGVMGGWGPLVGGCDGWVGSVGGWVLHTILSVDDSFQHRDSCEQRGGAKNTTKLNVQEYESTRLAVK